MVIAARALGFPQQCNPDNQINFSTEAKQPPLNFSSLLTFKIDLCMTNVPTLVSTVSDTLRKFLVLISGAN